MKVLFLFFVTSNQCSKLQSINLQSNLICAQDVNNLVELVQFKSDCELVLHGNLIGIGQLSIVLPQSIQTCDLSFNLIDDDGATSLAKVLGQCSNLDSVNLSSNQIGNRGAKALAECFQYLKKLRYLELGFNLISSVGAIFLATSLQMCSKLKTLNLYDNQIADAGAKCLIAKLVLLHSFDFSDNQIGYDFLTDGIGNSSHLEKLIISLDLMLHLWLHKV